MFNFSSNFSAVTVKRSFRSVLTAGIFLTLIGLFAPLESFSQFAAATNYAVGTNPQGIAAADFNNDRRADLVVANRGSDNISLLLGNGDGTFGAPTNFAVIGLGVLSNVVVADFNNDGNRDAAVGCGSGDRFFVLLGNGAGSFTTTQINAPGNATFIATADFNNDNNPDIVFRNSNSPTISVSLGNGLGGFAAPITFATNGNGLTVTAADFNNDNRQDLAVSVNNGTISIVVHLGNGNGTFGAAANFPTNGIGQIAVADFTGDGNLDIVANRFSQQDVLLLTGNGAGGFTVGSPVAALANPQEIVVGDFNADTRPDIAVGSSATSNFAYLQNNGSSGFNAPLTFTTGSQPISIITGDFDRDGRLDAATANAAGNNSSVLLNAFPPAPTAAIGGRVSTAANEGIRNVLVTLTDANGNRRTARTASFGFYRFTNVPTGVNYTLTVQAQKYSFVNPSATRTVNGNIGDVDFIAQ